VHDTCVAQFTIPRLVSAREWDNVIKLRHSALASDPAFPQAVVHYLTEAAGRVRFIDDEIEIARGIKVFW
jgi:hypothetical protein